MTKRLTKIKVDGVEMRLPDIGYAWLAMDRNGRCYAYKEKPKMKEFLTAQGWFLPPPRQNEGHYIGQVSPKKYDWKKSLTEIPIVTEIPNVG